MIQLYFGDIYIFFYNKLEIIIVKNKIYYQTFIELLFIYMYTKPII